MNSQVAPPPAPLEITSHIDFDNQLTSPKPGPLPVKGKFTTCPVQMQKRFHIWSDLNLFTYRKVYLNDDSLVVALMNTEQFWFKEYLEMVTKFIPGKVLYKDPVYSTKNNPTQPLLRIRFDKGAVIDGQVYTGEYIKRALVHPTKRINMVELPKTIQEIGFDVSMWLFGGEEGPEVGMTLYLKTAKTIADE
jgi:hypothetical protein